MSGVEPGQIIDGRYRVISRLGAGGMADVFLAEDEQLSRPVALKLLHRRFAADPGFVERFRREAQSAASLQHPHVVSVYDRGAFEDTYYIAMEYLPGRTLKQVIREEAPLAPLRAIDITLQMLKAARFAHRRGVIHRDLKPHNVIIDDQDQVKVTDFGIARAGASDMTETGSIMGTAQYLSPEQAQGQAVAEPSDLYSIGIVLYEMLTGRVPFDAESAVSIALKHVSEAPVEPVQLNPSVPPSLNQTVMWALNKNPADRPADADQFISVLEGVREQIASGRPGEATASMAAVSAAAAGLGAGGLLAGAAQQPSGAPAAHRLTSPELVGGLYQQGPTGEWTQAGSGAGGSGSGRDDDQGGRNVWPWVAIGLLALALIGGAVAFALTRPHKASVPDVVRLQLSVAQTDVQNAGFQVLVNNEASSAPSGIVIAQNPLSGARINTGSTVTLDVSTGPGNGTVPQVTGDSQAQAVAAIKRVGLKVAQIKYQSSANVPKGNAIMTQPSVGTSLPSGFGVELYVSTGPAAPKTKAVPNVVGMSQSDATTTLQNDGFKVSPSTQTTTSTSTTSTSTTTTAGNVVSQSPAATTSAKVGSTVSITIAAATPTASIPDVVGYTSADATRTLQAAGFKVKPRLKAVTDSAENGTVISQTPKGDATASDGSTVTIVVGEFSGTTTTTTTTSTTPPATTTTTSSTAVTTTTTDSSFL